MEREPKPFSEEKAKEIMEAEGLKERSQAEQDAFEAGEINMLESSSEEKWCRIRLELAKRAGIILKSWDGEKVVPIAYEEYLNYDNYRDEESSKGRAMINLEKSMKDARQCVPILSMKESKDGRFECLRCDFRKLLKSFGFSAMVRD